MRDLHTRELQRARQKRARELGRTPPELQKIAVLSQKDVGELLGVSPQMIAIIEQSAMRKIRQHFLKQKLHQSKYVI